MSLGRRGAALTVLVASLALAVCDASARPRIEVAFQDDRVFVEHGSGVSMETAYGALRELGVTRLRINVAWHRATGPQAYDLTHWDPVVDEARAHGLRIQLTLTGPAPPSATADHRTGNMRPDDGRFAEFAAATAFHFRGRVDRYSIWNEPNWGRYLTPRASAPALYRRLFRAAYSAIKGTDPSARVLFGELAPYGRPDHAVSPLPFLRHTLCGVRAHRYSSRCFRLRADGFALHPYSLRWPPDYPGPTRDDVTTGSLGRITRPLSRLSRMRVLATRRGKPLPLFLTEYGYPAHGRAVPAHLQAPYLRGGWALAAANPWVRQMTHYQLLPDPSSVWDTSLLTLDGSPRPAYLALRDWLARARACGLVKAVIPPS
jgi:hypothetical protein